MLSHAMFQKRNTCKVTFLHFVIEMYMKHELQTLYVLILVGILKLKIHTKFWFVFYSHVLNHNGFPNDLIESALSWLLEEKQVFHTQIIEF